MCKHPFGAVLLVMSFYFCVFILDLLDVKVDDGTGLIHEYEKIRRINEDLLKDEEVRQAAEAKLKFDHSLTTYQGDATHPWENPFAKPMFASAVRKNEALQELHNQLEDSIFHYLYQHRDDIPEPVLEVEADAEARMETLIRRQHMVEERFDKVSRLPTSLRVRDYEYRSPLSDPALTVPPTPSNLDDLAKKSSSVSSMLSSVVSSVFGGKTGSSSNRDSSDGGSAQAMGAGSEGQVPLPSSGAFAVLSDPAKNPKSASAIALESALTEAGFTRHSGAGLPLFMLAYGRACPNSKAIGAKDPTGQHVVFCAAYTGGQGARFVLTDPSAFAEAAQTIVPSAGADGSVFEPFVRLFHRFFDQEDRARLVDASATVAEVPVLVLQALGAGKPQLIKASSLPALLEKEPYVAEKPRIVGAPFVAEQMLWPGSSNAFMVRSWLVIHRAAPRLVASFHAGDVVKSEVEYAPFQGREAAEVTASMRFPAFAESAEHLPFAEHAGVLPGSFADDLRRAAAYAAVRLGASRPAEDSPPPEADVRLVQHLCLDFAVDSQSQTPVLVAISPNCDIETASPATKRAVTTDLVSGLVHGTAYDASSVVVDQAKGYIFY